MSESWKRYNLFTGKRLGKPVAKSTKKYVRSAIVKSSETKLRHLGGTSGGIGDGVSIPGANILVSDLTQGIAQSQRIGNKVTLTSFTFKGYMNLGDSQNIMRIVIYSPKEGTGGVIDPATTNLTTPLDFDKYVVYKDRYITANDAGSYYSPFSMTVKWSKGKTMLFDGNLSTDITHGSLYVYLVSDSGVAPSPSLSYIRNLRYKDL